MTDPYANLTPSERELVLLIAKAIGKGVLLPHNKVSPKAARRVFDALKQLEPAISGDLILQAQAESQRAMREL